MFLENICWSSGHLNSLVCGLYNVYNYVYKFFRLQIWISNNLLSSPCVFKDSISTINTEHYQESFFVNGINHVTEKGSISMVHCEDSRTKSNLFISVS